MITVVFCVHRLPGLSVDAFRRYWWEQHGPLVKARAGVLRIARYVQMPRLDAPGLDSVATARGAPEAYDGVAQVSWQNLTELQATFGDPAARTAARELLEDERRFIDLPRSPIFFTEEKVVVEQDGRQIKHG